MTEIGEQTLRGLWRFLPVFRVIAETQSVSEAARRLNVSPPAISKSLRAIETTLGRRLFERSGRRLHINPGGQALLKAVVASEQPIRSVVAELMPSSGVGTVRIGIVGQLDRIFVLPAIQRLRQTHPGLSMAVVHRHPEQAIEELIDERLDFYLALNVVPPSPIVSKTLTRLEMAVYAGRTHPLFGKTDLDIESIASHAFAAQQRQPMMRPIWPKRIARDVSLTVDSHALAVDACVAGGYLALLERIVAAPHLREGLLWEIPVPFLESPALRLCVHENRMRDPHIEAAYAATRYAVRATTKAAEADVISFER